MGSAIAGAAVALGFARRRRAGFLVFLNGPREGERVGLRNGRLRIGALAENEIVIPSKAVSRYHAELRVAPGQVEIWDLQSMNSTRVNGASVKTALLRTGDVIDLAGVELRYGR